MSTHKSIDRICVIAVIVSLLVMLVFVNGEILGIRSSGRALGYEERLFDTSQVHTIDITIDDWDGFLETCTEEQYSVCSLTIDGESYPDVGIRGKGNTSLSSVAAMDSRRYSFKVEFDQYDSTKSYYGLDKLSLNNLIQDNTYMKDCLVYRMMGEFGVDAPLCSYVNITVNGEPWGLYLAVEGVEDSFLQRNYGTDPGELYKPDSMSFGGGGPGNGKDFDFEEFLKSQEEDSSERAAGESAQTPDFSGGFTPPDMSGGDGSSFTPPDMDGENGSFTPPNMDSQGGGFTPPDMSGENGSFTPPNMNSEDGSFAPPDFSGEGPDLPGGMGMGSSDVKLQYTDDDPDSYSNIFNSAKTDITAGDQNRLIAALKNLNEQTDLEETVDVDEVLRYFVVHNFVVNADSYTGMMIHNYYLHEKDGQLAMIPWDYNLAFGTFQAGDAGGAVNDPVDTPLSADGRPMWSWIADSEEYTEQYHALFAEFLDTVDLAGMIQETAALIDPYVKEDATAFCTYEEYQKGVEALTSFCRLRTESVRGQLDGTIPSTSEGQKADDSNLIDASGLTLSDMGSMGGGMGGGMGGPGGSFPGGGDGFPFSGTQENGRPQRPDGNRPQQSSDGEPSPADGTASPESSQEETPPADGGGMGQERPSPPGGSFSPPSGFAGQEQNTVTSGTWVLMGCSIAVLAAGLFVAFRFRFHN